MTKTFDDYLGARPSLYGRNLLKRLGNQKYYVNEYDVIDFLGYEIKPLNPEEHKGILEYKGIGDIFDDLCAITFYRDNIMFISESMPPTRKRYTIFHEIGHEINEHHPKGLVSIGKNSDIDTTSYKLAERDAFLAGAEVMFPLKNFINDSTSLSLQFSSIESIAQRYCSSFEATAIRYTLTNQNIMAIVVVKENDLIDNIEKFTNNSSPNEYLLPLQIPFSQKPNLSPTPIAPLRVQYCIRSYLFPKFIKSGIEIGEDNLIYKSWKSNISLTGEIPASVFGSSAKFNYTAECRPINGRVFVLLSLPDNQLKLFNGVSLCG
ncbi:MAG: ImmA/IrrE family metallo-endopeptidase [bacterium]|nr:ImmA/IrrE family metallo-endopeptidase [bacterium]